MSVIFQNLKNLLNMSVYFITFFCVYIVPGNMTLNVPKAHGRVRRNMELIAMQSLNDSKFSFSTCFHRLIFRLMFWHTGWRPKWLQNIFQTHLCHRLTLQRKLIWTYNHQCLASEIPTYFPLSPLFFRKIYVIQIIVGTSFSSCLARSKDVISRSNIMAQIIIIHVIQWYMSHIDYYKELFNLNFQNKCTAMLQNDLKWTWKKFLFSSKYDPGYFLTGTGFVRSNVNLPYILIKRIHMYRCTKRPT